MENMENESNNSHKYPERSTTEDFDVFSMNSERLDLYFIRNFVSETEPQEVPLSSLESGVYSQLLDEDSPYHPAKFLMEFKRLSQDISRVLEEHSEWSEFLKRVIKTDYTYPVLIYKDVVIDGIHRILHAIIDGQQTIPAHILTSLPKEAYYSK